MFIVKIETGTGPMPDELADILDKVAAQLRADYAEYVERDEAPIEPVGTVPGPGDTLAEYVYET